MVTRGAQGIVDRLCGKIRPLNNRTRYGLQVAALIRAELIGSDTCSAHGFIARSSCPVLALCRKLLAAGFDSGRTLHAYRGTTLCLMVRSIGEAAGLEISSGGTRFIRYREARAASPVRRNGRGAT